MNDADAERLRTVLLRMAGSLESIDARLGKLDERLSTLETRVPPALPTALGALEDQVKGVRALLVEWTDDLGKRTRRLEFRQEQFDAKLGRVTGG